MTARACEWCGAPLSGNQIVSCCSSHRLKRWRWLNGIPVSPYGGVERPPEGSLLLDGPRASGGVQTASQGSRVSNGGLQAPFGRIEAVAFHRLTGPPAYINKVTARELARTIAVESLPERQRARLHEREAA